MVKSVLGVAENKCCGCGACSQICPKSCITMLENDRGFLVPDVNLDLCVNCGMCIGICPEKGQPEAYSVKNAYACVAVDMDIVKASTSGGVFRVLADRILSVGGVIYGCSWNDRIEAKHIRIEKICELHKIQQSKYVQSDTNKTFSMAKSDLENGICVLYSGTACQIAGLRKFLGKEYDNLYTLEVACHGVPSPGLFRKYIQWTEEKNGERVISFQFRNKEKHKKGEHYKFCVNFDSGRRKFFSAIEDPYYGSFLKGRTLRKTCYDCKYKGEQRVADFSLSDYWGIEKEHSSFPAKNGVSAVMVNTEKGERLFNSIKDSLVCKETTFNQIVSHNKSIISSAKCEESKQLCNIYAENNVLFKNLKPAFSIKNRLKSILPENLKYLLKRL